MAAEEPKITPTVSFRPSHGPRDEVVGDQKYGFVEQEVARERGRAPALLPPQSDRAAPQTPLAERMLQRLEQAEEPKITPTVSFRPNNGPRDEVVGDQKYGFVEQEVARERGRAPALLPPHSDKAAPQTPLAERLRQRLEQRRP